MSLSNLTVADLRQLEKLLSRKEQLQDQIADIDRSLVHMEQRSGGNGLGRTGKRRGRPPGVSTASRGTKRAAGGGRKGVLKAKITGALQTAGKQGLHVKELASRLKVGEPNIRVWFHATGKKIKNIKKVKPATYRWED